MARADNPLDATTQLLQESGISYTVGQRRKHMCVRAEGLPLIFCSNTASDFRAVAKQISVVRRIIRSAKP